VLPYRRNENLIMKGKKKMKNVIKKITAAAMAFTLLGAGSAVIKSAAPKTDNTIVANAANGDDDRYGFKVVRLLGEKFDKLWSKTYKTVEKGGNKVVGIAENRNKQLKELDEYFK